MAMLIVLVTHQRVNGEEISIGKIDRIKVPVTVLRSDGQEIIGKEQLPLFPGDQITTGKGGMIWFSLQKGRQFRLGEDAQMSVDELSALEMDDGQLVLRLVLGYLWSKIQKIRTKMGRLEVHTPTAVLGVRGTEFDTVVSLDATSIITVDEGIIEVDVEDEKIILDKGKMTQVELDIKPTPPIQAIPKEKRDWKAWRKKRIMMLFKKLPQVAPRFRKRFERAVNRFTGFTDKVNEASDRLSAAMEKVKEARMDRDRQKFIQSVRQLRAQVCGFKKMVAKFRRGLNRVRVMGKISYRIENFVTMNRESFGDQELATIESNLVIISQKRIQLKDISRQTIFNIRQTFKDLRELRKKIRRRGGQISN
jgi:hypothetical protein